jgi:hypothetical protein
MTTPQEPAAEPVKNRDEEQPTDPSGTTSADDVESDGPLDADEGDPQVDSYPG